MITTPQPSSEPSPIDDATEAYGAWIDDDACTDPDGHLWRMVDSRATCMHCGDVAE
jgi:hypothetical protein